ncbi:Outer membrane lipoprotein-sorting protein [uncultured Paludibacter sp.]|uniref:Outer membrane lipoprotein-sorting protein n=1 Tax=uncultured Paludibacter sp. TaxID=497635 RepID=A0A653AFL3_9BACT|nr:Outer membrane lipoprotein-sorting protein [uncultured Paludibacter sp.]
MKKSLKAAIFLILIIFGFQQMKAQTMNAKEVVSISFNLFLGNSSFSKMEITIVRPTWKRSMEMQTWSLGDKYYIAYIISPARDKGQVFLKYNNEMWNFVPTINRTVKIPPSMMMQSWMGSDFTNNDLMKQNSVVTDYSHEFVPEENFENSDCYVVSLKPLPNAAVVWGSIKMWIAKGNMNTLKIEYYDTHQKLIKTEIASNLQMMGGRLLASHMEMISNTKNGNKTIINVKDIQFNIGYINKDFFSIQNIKNIRPKN